MNAGDTFLLAEQHTDIDPHLWFILSDPEQNADQILIASLTTWRADKDQACVVERGEHPWVTHQSCVAYDFARVVTLAQLKEMRYTGSIKLQDPLSAGLLGRVRACAGDSTRLTMEFADLLIEQGLLDC